LSFVDHHYFVVLGSGTQNGLRQILPIKFTAVRDPTFVAADNP
jgi:hypothetical protein